MAALKPIDCPQGDNTPVSLKKGETRKLIALDVPVGAIVDWGLYGTGFTLSTKIDLIASDYKKTGVGETGESMDAHLLSKDRQITISALKDTGKFFVVVKARTGAAAANAAKQASRQTKA
jgi:hypothetical protein